MLDMGEFYSNATSDNSEFDACVTDDDLSIEESFFGSLA
jgi:hypothetical protein